MKRAIAGLAVASLTLAGCATASSSIATSYASPMMYQGYSCAQLAIEDEALRSQVSELKGSVDRSATNDKVMVGVGVLLFWPTLFLIKGNGEEQSEYANLKGEHQAIQHAFLLRGCAGGGTQVGGTAATPGFPAAQGGGFGDGSAVAGETRRF